VLRGSVEKINGDPALAPVRIALVVPVTLSKTSRVALTLQKND